MAARTRKKLEQMELMLLTHFPSYRLELHSPSDKVKSHTHTKTHVDTLYYCQVSILTDGRLE